MNQRHLLLALAAIALLSSLAFAAGRHLSSPYESPVEITANYPVEEAWAENN